MAGTGPKSRLKALEVVSSLVGGWQDNRKNRTLRMA